MDAKKIAFISLFVALVILLGQLTVSIRPMVFYFCEIPVVVALLLYGFKTGFSVAAIGIFAQALIFPKSIGIFFPIWNLVAMSTTLLAIALIQWIITRKTSNGSQTKKSRVNCVILFVVATLGIRLTVMPFVNFFIYKYVFPIVLGVTYADVTLMTWTVPILLIFDVILVLYTVPTSYMIAKRVNKDLKMGNTFL